MKFTTTYKATYHDGTTKEVSETEDIRGNKPEVSAMLFATDRLDRRFPLMNAKKIEITVEPAKS